MNINVLVLDTQVYSNTGGQMSKATPRAAVAKFASGGKNRQKGSGNGGRQLWRCLCGARGHGSSDAHTVKAFLEAEAYDGAWIIIAYSQCIAHGYDMAFGMRQQKAAVLSGYWPLMRYNPALRKEGRNPFQLDSKPPSIPFKQYAYQEARYAMLTRSDPETARELLRIAQDDVDRNWYEYQSRAAVPPQPSAPDDNEARTCDKRQFPNRGRAMINLTTNYLGLKLSNPIVASASPLTDSVDNIRRLEDHGIAAVVLPSLFEEQLDLESQAVDSDLSRGSEDFPKL